MNGWIKITDKVPEGVTEPVWVLFCRKSGMPRKCNAVIDADFAAKILGGSFFIGKHRNFVLSLRNCVDNGLTHWQLRLGEAMPNPEIDNPIPRLKTKAYDKEWWREYRIKCNQRAQSIG